MKSAPYDQINPFVAIIKVIDTYLQFYCRKSKILLIFAKIRFDQCQKALMISS